MGKTDKIHILVFADGMPAGGTERQIVELLKGLQRYCPQIYTYFGVLVKGGEREVEANYWADETVQLRQSHPLDISLAWSLTRFVRQERVDIIHTFGSISDIAGVVAAKITGAKLINGSIRSARKKLTRRDKLSKFAMRFADKIVANSHAGLKAFGMQDLATASVVYNGLDIRPLEEAERFDNDAPYICMVGNFTQKKDQKALIEALPGIRQKFPQHQLFLIGKGGREKEYLDLIHQTGQDGNIFVVNDCNAPGKYIKSADVCVLLSSDGEGLSNVIMEYCALGKPVVATYSGGNPEIIEQGCSGLLVQSHAKKEIYNAVLALLTDKEMSECFGRRAKQIISEKFSQEKMVLQYSSLYKALWKER